MKHWHVIQAEPGREIRSSIAVAGLGIESYVPVIGDRARFSPYFFGRFALSDEWPELVGARARRYFAVGIIRRPDGVPSIMPDAAMDAIRAFRPPVEKPRPDPHVFQSGERVTWTRGGKRYDAVFLEHVGRGRSMVRTWILGAERTSEANPADLEPLDMWQGFGKMAAT